MFVFTTLDVTVFVLDGSCRLADFGLSRKIMPGEVVQEICGTPEYTGKGGDDDDVTQQKIEWHSIVTWNSTKKSCKATDGHKNLLVPLTTWENMSSGPPDPRPAQIRKQVESVPFRLLSVPYHFFLSLAPEILNYNPITTAADLWSLGAVLYVMLTGYSPFAGESLQETYLNVAKGM